MGGNAKLDNLRRGVVRQLLFEILQLEGLGQPILVWKLLFLSWHHRRDVMVFYILDITVVVVLKCQSAILGTNNGASLGKERVATTMDEHLHDEKQAKDEQEANVPSSRNTTLGPVQEAVEPFATTIVSYHVQDKAK